MADSTYTKGHLNQDENGPSKAVFVEDEGLYSLQARPSLGAYILEIWKRKHFIAAEARSKALKAGRNTFLGHLWIILNPLLQVSLYAFVFGFILKTSRGMDNFIGFLVIGVIFFGFLSKGLSGGVTLIQSSRSMIGSFAFPKASLAISATLRQLIDNLGPAMVAIVVAIAFQWDSPIHWTVVFVIPLFLLVHVFTLGTTLIVARATAFIPDLKAIVNLLTRGLFFVSGIFYSIERFATEPWLQTIMTSNPIYQFLQAVRSCVLDGVIPNLSVWGYLTCWSFGLLLIGMIYFWLAEERYTGVQ